MPMLTGTLLTINVLLDLEDLLETIKLLITNHLIHDIVHQWLYQKKKFSTLIVGCQKSTLQTPYEDALIEIGFFNERKM